MSELHLLRLPVSAPRLLRFAAKHGITGEDTDLGYALHAWLAALFGPDAPKPFRYFERKGEVLAYARADAPTLLAKAQAYASPLAWAALRQEGVSSKPMPAPQSWRIGQRLNMEALVCPVARRDDGEKDVYLRALERLGSAAPSRAEVYRQWFLRQLGDAVQVEALDLLSQSAQVSTLRRDRSAGRRRLHIVQRPRALFSAKVRVANPERFAHLLARGVGRHRAFGCGMVLLAPAR